MAGTFTSTRGIHTGHTVLHETYSWPNRAWVTDYGPLDPWFPAPNVASGSFQTTTSYRSGRSARGLSQEDQDDTDELSARTYAERTKVRQRKNKRYSRHSTGDTGHEFFTQKRTVTSSRVTTQYVYGNGDYRYSGPVGPNTTGLRLSYPWADPPSIDTGYYGPKAIGQTRPTAPQAKLAILLAELKREGITAPGLQSIQNRTNDLRSAGSEYLNMEFGWKPLLREVENTMKAVSESGRILRQFQRDSGKTVRRSCNFPEIVQADQVTYPGSVRDYANTTATQGMWAGNDPSGTVTETLITRQRIWFNGAYTYYLQPDGSIFQDAASFEQKANLLLGTRITPEVLWNLTPWSWLLDWNWNIGQNISNATALSSDGLVLRYGYLMVHTVQEHTATIVGPRLKTGGFSGPFTTTWRTETKQRLKAPPYGFGSDPASYTDRQWTILGALGLTKAPGKLAV